MLTSFITSTIWCRILREANKDRSFIKHATTPCNRRSALLRMPLLSKTNSLTISSFRESWDLWEPRLCGSFRVFISGCVRDSEPFHFWWQAGMPSGSFLFISLLCWDRWASIWDLKGSRRSTPQSPRRKLFHISESSWASECSLFTSCHFPPLIWPG